MVEQLTSKESTRELVKLSVLLAILFILLVNIPGFMVTKFYLAHLAHVPPIVLSVIMRLNIVRHVLLINSFFIIPILVFAFILLFLTENFVVKNHKVTYAIYNKINLFLIFLNVFIVVALLLFLIIR